MASTEMAKNGCLGKYSIPKVAKRKIGCAGDCGAAYGMCIRIYRLLFHDASGACYTIGGGDGKDIYSLCE